MKSLQKGLILKSRVCGGGGAATRSGEHGLLVNKFIVIFVFHRFHRAFQLQTF
jgi:hypothetical protein